jgi:hypothetical protein
MSDFVEPTMSRRQFAKTAAAAAAASAAALAAPAIAAPAIVTASKTDSEIILGEGDYRYAVKHDWPQLPSQFTWQTTHDVTIDRDGLIYVVHEGKEDHRDHPTIFVFDPDGKYVRSFGKELAGGAHGMDLRDEAGEQFLYVCSYRPKTIVKLSLTGEIVWQRFAPMESKIYAEGEDQDRHVYGKRDTFMPTNFAFLPDGGFLVADGYGSFFVHRYDKDANWLSCFGGPGDGDKTFINPHGIWIDDRPGREPRILVTDRVRHKLKWFTLDGEYLETLDGLLLPSNIDIRDGVLLVPDLDARITLLDKDNKVIVHLANDDQWREAVNKQKLRTKPDAWQAGKFCHPHDACFDHAGNIMVAEWVVPGRVTKLTRLG